MDVAEAITKSIKEQHPGVKKVMFAGDLPNNHPDKDKIKEKVKKLYKTLAEMFVDGKCHVCGKQMPDFRPDDDNWDIPTDWHLLESIGDAAPPLWECQDCDPDKENLS